MGAINPAKIRKVKRKDADKPVTLYKEGGEVWDNPSPSKNPKKLSSAQKAKAKARAKAAGRPYPNLIDNMGVARKSR
jgi:hypothetical protein